MESDIHYAVSEILSRMPALMQDSPINSEAVILSLISKAVTDTVEQTVKSRADVWRQMVEANARPGDVANLIMDRDEAQAKLKLCQEALKSGFEDLKDVASGYSPYPYNHEQNPFCETLVLMGKALGMPEWKIFPEDSDPWEAKRENSRSAT